MSSLLQADAHWPRSLQTAASRAAFDEAMQKGAYFTGCNPAAVASWFDTHPRVVPGSVRMSDPWRWDVVRKDHTFLVVAISFRIRP